MGAALLLRSELESRTGTRLVLVRAAAPETVSTGIAEIDALTGGLPRGCLTEITGPLSSGRTSVIVSALACATASQESCVVIDAGDRLHPASARAAGVDLARVLWVRCGGDAEKALKAADLLLQAGGFGFVVMDLGDIPSRSVRRISMTSWFRLRRAVENTPTILLVVEREPHAKTCASLVLEVARRRANWTGMAGCSRLFRGLDMQAVRRKPIAQGVAIVEGLRAVE